MNVLTDLTINGKLSAESIAKENGTASQFLKADGSVDDKQYMIAPTSGTGLSPYYLGEQITNSVTNWARMTSSQTELVLKALFFSQNKTLFGIPMNTSLSCIMFGRNNGGMGMIVIARDTPSVRFLGGRDTRAWKIELTGTDGKSYNLDDLDDISSMQDNIATIKGNIVTLQEDVTNATVTINAVKTDVSNLQIEVAVIEAFRKEILNGDGLHTTLATSSIENSGVLLEQIEMLLANGNQTTMMTDTIEVANYTGGELDFTTLASSLAGTTKFVANKRIHVYIASIEKNPLTLVGCFNNFSAQHLAGITGGKELVNCGAKMEIWWNKSNASFFVDVEPMVFATKK